MTSHVLLEGILDVKDPRGSEDRKFWKAWRRQWVSFSVIYPSGRREPHLLLKLSHSSSETPERQIRVQREGLRIFRCRSKSRPYRTWAIMSGNKLVMYFAAESEIEAQNWMKELRDGLWPTCFSFQMLTACSHEVSLIDDENTFLSGLLGVYGRFVLTSDDVISLMHPHWGCTLLQISLSSICDVIFSRQAEINSAGVFSIVLKRDEESKVKTLQFFCSTAMDVIQWILNKIYENREKSSELPKSNFPIESSTVGSDNIACFKDSTDLEFRNPSFFTEKITDSYINMVHSNTDYENMEFLKINSIFNSGDCIISNTSSTTESSVKNNQNNFTDVKEHISGKPTKLIDSSIYIRAENKDNQDLVNSLSNTKLDENNFYTNFTNRMDFTSVKSKNCSNYNVSDMYISMDSSTKYNNEVTSNENTATTETFTAMYDTLNSGIYSTINKIKATSNSSSKRDLEEFSTNELFNRENVINNPLSKKDPKLDRVVLSSNSDYREADYSVTTSTNNLIPEYLTDDLKTEYEIPTYCNVDFFSKDSVSPALAGSLYGLNTPVLEDVQKQKSLPSKPETTHSFQISANNFSSGKFLKEENNTLFLNIPTDILNTSFSNSTTYKSKASSVGSASDEDKEILPWVMDELINLDIDEGIYEDILDRKGTIYEEIDSSESENECTFQLPPSLPERPQNLEIPDSLRLQKLSNNIKQTLDTSDKSSTPIKRYPRPAFIKKIKDINRITQINPTQETSKEPFAVETKLPVHVTENIFVLKPTVNNSQVKINMVQDKGDEKTSPKNVS